MVLADRDVTTAALLERVVEHTRTYLDSLPDAPVGTNATHEDLLAALGGPLQGEGIDPAQVIEELVEGVSPGLVRMPSGRFFGFVIGGTLPVALAADWLASGWDQNAGLYAPTPGASTAEEVAGAWLKQLLGLPQSVSFAFVTGGQMANYTALAAARHHVLAAAGWDVEHTGLAGAPRIRVVAGARRHATIDRALRFLGLGTDSLQLVDVDAQGRMSPSSLQRVLGGDGGPTIVCAQAGEVNTGAFDDFTAACEIAHASGAWVHVDGSFGLWAAASPELRHLVAGVDQADSWSVDCHKWLNVPYDCGAALCAHPSSHRASMTAHAEYLIQSAEGGPRDPVDWNPEFSRRARALPVYAALRSLGTSGVASLVERCCARARQFAEALGGKAGIRILNDVVLNQVLVRFASGDDDDAGDERTRAVIERVQQSGVCWMSGTTWQGRAAMRISVSNWRTSEEDVERSVAAILEAAAQPEGARP